MAAVSEVRSTPQLDMFSPKTPFSIAAHPLLTHPDIVSQLTDQIATQQVTLQQERLRWRTEALQNNDASQIGLANPRKRRVEETPSFKTVKENISAYKSADTVGVIYQGRLEIIETAPEEHTVFIASPMLAEATESIAATTRSLQEMQRKKREYRRINAFFADKESTSVLGELEYWMTQLRAIDIPEEQKQEELQSVYHTAANVLQGRLPSVVIKALFKPGYKPRRQTSHDVIAHYEQVTGKKVQSIPKRKLKTSHGEKQARSTDTEIILPPILTALMEEAEKRKTRQQVIPLRNVAVYKGEKIPDFVVAQPTKEEQPSLNMLVEEAIRATQARMRARGMGSTNLFEEMVPSNDNTQVPKKGVIIDMQQQGDRYALLHATSKQFSSP